MSTTSRYRIADAVTDEERAALFVLRYQVFVNELGYRIDGADPAVGLVEPEDAHAFIVGVYDGEVPVGTVAADGWGRGDITASRVESYRLRDFADAFGREAVYITRKAAVRRNYRKTTVFLNTIVRIGEIIFGHPASRFIFIETSPYLMPLYERLGYRRYAPHFTYDDTGAIAVPMCFVIDDHEHLARVRSPLLPVLKRLGRTHQPDMQRDFRDRWEGPATAADGPESAEPALDPHDDAARALAPEQIGLFDGVEPAEVAQFLGASRARRFRAKEALIEAGAGDTDLYLITSGFVEITRATKDGNIPVATRGPGDLIGEMNMLLRTGRTTTVTALTDVEALVIPERVFHDGAGDSALRARINLNLARMLARRLRVSDALITERPPL